MPKPISISWMNSASPAGTWRTPAGRFFTEGRRLTAWPAAPVVMPSSSAEIEAMRERS
ncbi:hypothetical protein D9M68_1004410 [compost metagenome]